MAERIMNYNTLIKLMRGRWDKSDYPVKNISDFILNFKLFKVYDETEADLIRQHFPRWYKEYLPLFARKENGEVDDVDVVNTFEFHHWLYTFFESDDDIYVLIQIKELE